LNIQIPNAPALLKNARDEIIAAASNFVTDPDARKVLGDATSKLISTCQTNINHRPSTIELQALATIKDPAAKRIFQSVLSGQCSPQSVFAVTDGLLIQVLAKSDLSSNVAKLLIADNAPAPKISSKGAVLSGAILSGTLFIGNKTIRGYFMQLPGVGTPNEQFQPDGSSQKTVGFWIQVS